MNNASINCYMVSLSVNSSHDSNLEFILDNAEKRANKQKKHYTECLYKMLHEELDKVEAKLTNTWVYGHIGLIIEADTLDQLQKAISVADKAIKKWLKKYNIERMKEA